MISGAQYGGSFSDKGWTMINDQLLKRNVRPIEFELCELKSFRLSDDGNRMIFIQRDGTRHPPLIFLDEGPDELIKVMKRWGNAFVTYLTELGDKIEKMFKGSLDSIPSPSVKIQIKVGMTHFQLFYEIKLKASKFNVLAFWSQQRYHDKI